jgi:hypothetical protein
LVGEAAGTAKAVGDEREVEALLVAQRSKRVERRPEVERDLAPMRAAVEVALGHLGVLRLDLARVDAAFRRQRSRHRDRRVAAVGADLEDAVALFNPSGELLFSNGNEDELAGHLGLGKLIYLYDQNEITLAGTIGLSFSEDIPARFRAVGWHVQEIDGMDTDQVRAALLGDVAEALFAGRGREAEERPVDAGVVHLCDESARPELDDVRGQEVLGVILAVDGVLDV